MTTVKSVYFRSSKMSLFLSSFMYNLSTAVAFLYNICDLFLFFFQPELLDFVVERNPVYAQDLSTFSYVPIA